MGIALGQHGVNCVAHSASRSEAKTAVQELTLKIGSYAIVHNPLHYPVTQRPKGKRA